MRASNKILKDIRVFLEWLVAVSAWVALWIYLGYLAFKKMWVATTRYYQCTKQTPRPFTTCHSQLYLLHTHVGIILLPFVFVAITWTILYLIFRR